MQSYNSVTSTRRLGILAIVIAVLLVTVIGMANSAAQDRKPQLVVVEDSPSSLAAESEDLVGQIEERDVQIAVLHEQVAFLQQAALSSDLRADEHQDTLLQEQRDLRFSKPHQTQSMNEWRIGYSLGGGQNLRAFETVILPCESGGEADPDAAVGPTDDWGRAQINRPTWAARFRELTGAAFEEHIDTPILNGFMAAHVETEQGLSAWTCWRKR